MLHILELNFPYVRGSECKGIIEFFILIPIGFAGLAKATLRRMNAMSKHVVIVEDHFAIQETLKFNLKMNGYSVSLAKDGLEALALLENTHPSIMLPDLNLPRMDGYTLLERLEKQKPELSFPIIIISGDPQAATRLAQKPYKLVPKPFPFQSILTIIQETLTVDKAT
jgi:CheY-like chemotaxis protein